MNEAREKWEPAGIEAMATRFLAGVELIAYPGCYE